MTIISIYYDKNFSAGRGVFGSNESLDKESMEFPETSDEYQGSQTKRNALSSSDNTPLPRAGYDTLYRFAINRLQGDFQLR